MPRGRFALLVTFALIGPLLPATAAPPPETPAGDWSLEVEAVLLAREVDRRGGFGAIEPEFRGAVRAALGHAEFSLLLAIEPLDHERTTILIRLRGGGGPEELRHVVFGPIDAIAPFLGGPIRLDLVGDTQAQDDFEIVLETSASTGYGWVAASIDPSLQGDAQAELLPPKTPMPPGFTGWTQKARFGFRPTSTGRTALRLLYRRPFERDRPATRRLKVEVGRLRGRLDLSDFRSRPVPDAGLRPAPKTGPALHAPPPQALPSYFSWVDLGKVTPIRYQGECGSCWAFATVGVMETAMLVQSGIAEDLSEQFLVSCNLEYWGCYGGWWAHGYHTHILGWQQADIGAVLESDFPYVAPEQPYEPCWPMLPHPHRLSTFFALGADTLAIKEAIYRYGAVDSVICAGPKFHEYRGGIFATDESQYCWTTTAAVETGQHMLVLVGWNDADDTWIARNSWGDWWGEGGYVRMRRGTSGIGMTGGYYVVYEKPIITSFGPPGGGAGTPVQISGTGFVDVREVRFNGTSAPPFTVDSPTSISATVPWEATSGPITVHTLGALAQSPTDFFVDLQGRPDVQPAAPSGIGMWSATLNATVNPNGGPTTGYFLYGLSSPPNESTPPVDLGHGSVAVPMSQPLSSLKCGTKYYWTARASNPAGASRTNVRTFSTASCPPPTVTTGLASAVEATQATLNGSVNPNGAATFGFFEFGTTTSYGQKTYDYQIGAGVAAVPVSATINNLSCDTTYHYRAGGRSSSGTSYGQDATFGTSADCPPPSAWTGLASNVTASSATLNGTVLPNGSAATAWFEYGATPAYGSSTARQDIGAAATAFSSSVSSLTCGTTYHFRVMAENRGGTTVGDDVSFSTSKCGLDILTVTPCRVIDTRYPPGGPYTGPALAAGETRRFTLAGQCGIPSSARTVSANVTVSQATAPGHLRLFPGDAPLPAASTVNYRAGETRANNAILVLGAAGDVAVYVGQASGTVHMMLDVNGYFE